MIVCIPGMNDALHGVAGHVGRGQGQETCNTAQRSGQDKM